MEKSGEKSLLVGNSVTAVYTRRWYIIFAFSIGSFSQVYLAQKQFIQWQVKQLNRR